MSIPDKESQFLIEVEAHLNSLYQFGLYLTGGTFDAEDLLQQTLLRAYERFYQYTCGTNCRAWLLKIMRNLWLMSLREKRGMVGIHPQGGGDVNGNIHELYPPPENPEELLLRKLSLEEIWRAIQRLPEQYREVVLLADVEEMSYEEIAEILECPLGTVRSRLYRGRNRLKVELSRLNNSIVEVKSENEAMS